MVKEGQMIYLYRENGDWHSEMGLLSKTVLFKWAGTIKDQWYCKSTGLQLEGGWKKKKNILKCKCILHITVFEKKKKTLKFRVMICIGEGRMGGWVIFFLMYEDTVFLELWLGYTRMLGHALCHLCFPSIVSCDHDSIPKAKLPSKKENEQKKNKKQTFTVLHLTPFDPSASLNERLYMWTFC